jgi:hypothetical protein
MPPEIPSQITPQNANIHLNEIWTRERAIVGSYRLRSSDTNMATSITPAADADLDVETTSIIEKPRTEAATRISPTQIIVDCHELFRELGISILRYSKAGEVSPASGKYLGVACCSNSPHQTYTTVVPKAYY